VLLDNEHGSVTVDTAEDVIRAAELTGIAPIVRPVANRPEVIAVAAVHRVGLLAIGDLAVVVAVSCGHRHEAFDAGKQLIDDVKANVPIWKRQVFTDGDVEWVGLH
jgi:molybdopterin synthase catalytic subunit